MRLAIDHRTTYRFSEPQRRLVQMLRLTPPNTHDQTVAAWRINVDCDARMRRARDGWGNQVTMLYVDGPIDAIEIAVEGAVLTSHSDGILHGLVEPLPPTVFLRDTPLTARDDGIAGWARQVADGQEALAALHALNDALHRRLPVDAARPEPGLSAGEAFARPRATPRDLAQIFTVAARSLGHPARYVSGYCVGGFLGSERPSPHGWAEAHVTGLGWVGFDPCTGLSPEEAYVRVASALDAMGAAPVAGSRMGPGREELDVAVQVGRDD